MLKVTDINVSYGAIHVIHGVSLEVNKGEIVSLIGANGAGKTTILHTISGLKKATTGTVMLDGVDIQAISPEKIVTLGMAHVPEGRHVFTSMTVLENLEMGAFFRKDKEQIAEDLKMVLGKFPRLNERKKQLAGTLSGGEQQMLAMGRAMMSRPEILLLDEPSMGLSPLLVKEIFHIIKELNEGGMTILLVEQNAKMALSIANRAYVLETGNVVLQGKGQDMLSDDSVRKAYLGA